MVAVAEQQRIVLRGNNAKLLEPLILMGAGQTERATRLAKTFPETLCVGPAGTGKTRTICEYISIATEMFPGIRALVCRQTLVSLRQSVQVTLEEKVWSDPAGWRPLQTDATRENTIGYKFPRIRNVVGGKVYEGASEVVLGGLDKPERTFSTEYDIVWVEEAIEVSKDAWEKLLRVNRNWRMPWQVAIASTNPGSEYHWLYKRSHFTDEGRKRPLMRHLPSTHKDNPAMWDEAAQDWTPQGADYLANLGHMSGARRLNLLEGKWGGEEGQIWSHFDESVHVIPRSQVPEIKWAFGAQDWGYSNPGCYQLWGVDAEGSIYRLYVAYHSKKHIDWWASMISHATRRLRDEHQAPNLLTVADPAEPDSIDRENDMLDMPRHTDGEPFVRKANNDWQTGRDLVDMALQPDPDTGKPRIYWVENALLHPPDRELEARGEPMDDIQEIPAWVFRQVEDGKPLKGREQEDPSRANHGCACTRYAGNFKWLRDLTPEPAPPSFETGSLGDLLGHEEVTFSEW